MSILFRNDVGVSNIFATSIKILNFKSLNQLLLKKSKLNEFLCSL